MSSRDLKDFFLFWDHMNPSNAWEGKLQVHIFFTISIHVQAVCLDS